MKFTGLTSRAVDPNNLEKQDVGTAVEVFNTKTAEGIDLLAEYREEDAAFIGYQETTALVRTIAKQFDVTNGRKRELDERHLFGHMGSCKWLSDERFEAFGVHDRFNDDLELMTRRKGVAPT